MSLSREQMLKELELLPVWQSNGERPAVTAKLADMAAALLIILVFVFNLSARYFRGRNTLR